MSKMIRCDKCKKMMFADSRSPKGAYAKFSKEYLDGYSTFHMCKACLRQFETEFMRFVKPEEFDDYYGPIEEDEPVGGDYERAVEQLEHDMLYEPTFNPDDGSM